MTDPLKSDDSHNHTIQTAYPGGPVRSLVSEDGQTKVLLGQLYSPAGTPVSDPVAEAAHAAQHAGMGVSKGFMFGNAPNRNRVILTGDSKTAMNGGTSIATPVQALGASYDCKGQFNHANFLLNHAFEVVGNAGIGGQKSAQILARFQTDVLSRASEWVCGMAGTNDTSSSNTGNASTTDVNIIAMWDLAVAAGRRVLWYTIPPKTSAADAENQYHMQINRLLKIAASRRPNVVLVSQESATLDVTTTFKALSSMLTDGTHESAIGAAVEGKLIADAVRPFISPVNPWLAQSNGDTENLLTNPMLSGSGSATPTGWNKIGTPTISYVAATDGVAYPWCQLNVANGTSGGQGLTSNVSVGSGMAIGDTIIGVVEFAGDSYDAAAAANTQGICLKLQAYNGASFFASVSDLYWDTTYPNFALQGSGVFQTPPFVVPAGTTLVQMYASINGGGNYRFRRAAIRNLTKLGLA
ncbi:SGNH/GDSL hydrolase family protein [Curvibacter lanceolatus]|uniref:SGNH/GDSL hydrolase family protein n=1 Tax=Curvibacter lanceolatus TaxID=86182 RepID=UPI00039A2C15|nr:SGNH/GDSL hydrolase family protein [Curvibacter lanceolatus]